MKRLIPIILIMALVFLAGCQVNNETKYQCSNGEIVDSLDLCSSQNCSECPKQVETETQEIIQYQCVNGAVVDSLELCSSQVCPELNYSKCPTQVETETKEVIKYQCFDGSIEEKLSNCNEPETIIKYQCKDGTVKDSLKDCDIIQVNQKEESTNDIDYKFDNYGDYQDYIKEEISTLTNRELSSYGGNEARYNGSVFFIMWAHGDTWGEIYNFWAVEINAKTGEILRYKEI